MSGFFGGFFLFLKGFFNVCFVLCFFIFKSFLCLFEGFLSFF